MDSSVAEALVGAPHNWTVILRICLVLPLHKCKFTLDRARITHPFIPGYSQMKMHVLSSQPCITFCYRPALSTNISLPVQKGDKTRWWNCQYKSQYNSQETYLYYKKSSRKPSKLLLSHGLQNTLLSFISQNWHLKIWVTLQLLADLLPFSNKQKKLNRNKKEFLHLQPPG